MYYDARIVIHRRDRAITKSDAHGLTDRRADSCGTSVKCHLISSGMAVSVQEHQPK